MTHKTLQLLLSGWITAIYQLRDALAVDTNAFTYSPENRALDLRAPVEVCTCLVTYNGRMEEDSVVLTHYTVEEFLKSPRIKHGPASFYQISHDSMNFFAACCFMDYMTDGNYDDSKAIRTNNESY